MTEDEQTPYAEAPLFPDEDGLHEDRCQVWHLSFQRLLSEGFLRQRQPTTRNEDLKLAHLVNSIPTRYMLTAKDPESGEPLPAEKVQDAIFKAVSLLMREDRDDHGTFLKQACAWFTDPAHSLPGVSCANSP